MRKLPLAATVLLGTALWTTAGYAGPCGTASVATYSAAGFSCSVDGVTFSNIAVTTITSGSGTVTLGDFTPFTVGNENGLALTYSATTGTTPGSTADVSWIYNVAGAPGLIDAFASFTGTTTGTGTADLSETLSNGVVLSLTGPGSTTATFPAVPSLGVIKDQNNFSGSEGSSETSVLENGFSTTTSVPEPASLGLLGMGLLGLGLIRRLRRSV